MNENINIREIFSTGISIEKFSPRIYFRSITRLVIRPQIFIKVLIYRGETTKAIRVRFLSIFLRAAHKDKLMETPQIKLPNRMVMISKINVIEIESRKAKPGWCSINFPSLFIIFNAFIDFHSFAYFCCEA